MKTKTAYSILIVLLLLRFYAYSQTDSITREYSTIHENLILNPSFEQYSVCPESFTKSYKKSIEINWTSPNEGTPDYYNVCSKGDVGIPQNWTGYTDTSNGQAYVGFYLYRHKAYREFIQGELKSKLEIGKKYTFSFLISQALYAEYISPTIGVLLIDEKLTSLAELQSSYEFNTEEELSIRKKGKLKQYKDQKTESLMDINTELGQYYICDITTDIDAVWSKVKVEFVAESEVSYFIIGNFLDKNQFYFDKNENWHDKEPMLKKSSYVLVDDFSLYETGKIEVQDSVFVLSDINFEFDSSTILDKGKQQLDSIYSYYLSKTKKYISVIGHTDSLGSDFHNDVLSKSRALEVQKYLIHQGLDSDQIQNIGKGESEPIVPNNTEINRKRNRRVEIHLN